MRHRRVLVPIALLLTLVIAAGLYWFQPWKLFVDHRVDEALPTIAAAAPNPTPGTTRPDTAASNTAGSAALDAAAPAATPAPSTSARRGNVLLSRGALIPHEHDTSGTVSVVELADGSRVLTVQNLQTSDGPDVQVWLSAAPVIAGEKGWYVFAGRPHVNLGALKGNRGNQVYAIPPGVDLTKYRSVSLWCARFDVSFGAAKLTAS